MVLTVSFHSNAQLNVDIARANLRGARLSYLPSLALSPNGAGASYAGSDLSWTYTLPAQLSWEIDIFGKILNSKRGAQAALYRSEAYAQAVRPAGGHFHGNSGRKNPSSLSPACSRNSPAEGRCPRSP